MSNPFSKGGNESNRNNQDYNRNGESNRNNDYNRNIPYSTQISSASIRAPLNGQSQGNDDNSEQAIQHLTVDKLRLQYHSITRSVAGAAPMIRHQAYDIPSSHQLKSEVVMVPPELCQFVADPHFQQILLKVKVWQHNDSYTLLDVQVNPPPHYHTIAILGTIEDQLYHG